ncbi:MAG: glycosyl hydrolase 53 family protein [Fibrobacter sp.]|uniref:glycosyl hydrolase 53 family protein n=1 Tax=Fibrobacter sp. TaxID=35828 RepID=UPI0025C6F379|nr:glycosyl hydrolase 53 family protein [Fibrobacter sp.]MBR4786067.1 glycosyl hydrolase 53 family protein [Fibrobacter sp.]
MGNRKGCFEFRAACRLFGAAAFAVFASAFFVACDNGGGSAGYDFEIVGDSSADTSQPSVDASSDALASLPSSEALGPQSSAVEPPQSSSDVAEPESSNGNPAMESSSSLSSSSRAPQSSAVEPPRSSASEQLLDFEFYTGADISTVQEYERNRTKFYDVDGSEKDIFTLLKDHGFNAIRLKTFVDPKAKYGYAASGCGHEAEAYADKEHIVAYAQKIKAAGMAFLLDIHYSDNWADPGKQIIPERWRKVSSSDVLADSVYAYTLDLMKALKQVGAIPEMVQVGNETTPGILIHVPNSKTDCWGNGVDKASTAINGDMGTASGKANAAKYFKAGIKAVKEVSPSTKTVLHIERIRQSNTVTWWMTEIFKNQKVPADVMGFSAYTAYGDGAPDNWKSLFQSVTSSYPDLEFIVAEYNGGDSDNHYKFDGSRKRTNEMAKGMNRWIGTFFWEPTLGGAWGPALFDWKGSNLQANSKAFEEFPAQ